MKALLIGALAALTCGTGAANAASAAPPGDRTLAGAVEQHQWVVYYGGYDPYRYDRYDPYDRYDRYDRRDDRRWRHGRHRGEWRRYQSRYVTRCHNEWRYGYVMRVCHRVRIVL